MNTKIKKDLFAELTKDEIINVVEYTVQKIKNYPKRYGKTIENYFNILLNDEVKAYSNRKRINNYASEKARG